MLKSYYIIIHLTESRFSTKISTLFYAFDAFIYFEPLFQQFKPLTTCCFHIFCPSSFCTYNCHFNNFHKTCRKNPQPCSWMAFANTGNVNTSLEFPDRIEAIRNSIWWWDAIVTVSLIDTRIPTYLFIA